jgi:hypothetical protein
VTKRKPPKRAPFTLTIDNAKTTPHSSQTETAPLGAAAQNEMATPGPWRSMEWSKPEPGKIVLFFVMGRVMAGMRAYGPMGGDEFFAYDDLGGTSIFSLPREAFTHWRDLPSERP